MYLPTFLSYIVLSFMTRLSQCNDRPIIGILTQETYWSSLRKYVKNENCSYIASSYVKSVEASGGRVIPVFTNKTTTYYEWVTTTDTFELRLWDRQYILSNVIEK